MEEPISPEEDLELELLKQEGATHGFLFQINQLFVLCCDESLSMDQLRDKSQPIIEKLKVENGPVAREIEELMSVGEKQKLLDYFEREKQQLAYVLSDELQQHRAISKRINDEKASEQPTDS